MSPPPIPKEVIERVRYTGSAEHKRYPSSAGNPALRTDATACPSSIGYEEARSALEDAIRESVRGGLHSERMDGAFPRYVWGAVDVGRPAKRIHFEARLTNRTLGEYKAYPIESSHESDHLPDPVRERLWPHS